MKLTIASLLVFLSVQACCAATEQYSDGSDAIATDSGTADACSALGGRYEYTKTVSYQYVGRGFCQSFEYDRPLRKCIYANSEVAVTTANQCSGSHECATSYASRVRIAADDTTECTFDTASGNCFATVHVSEVGYYSDSSWHEQCN